MERVRQPLQGVKNIIRFNWHFYALSLALLTGLLVLGFRGNGMWTIYVYAIMALVIITLTVSLLVSWYVYDHSGLYRLGWLDQIAINRTGRMITINAGFDETSEMLAQKFPEKELIVFDFYDPTRHTEVSIRRARKVYPPWPGTKTINTSHLPLPTESANTIFAILSAHEIRDKEEQVRFFTELERVLQPGGRIIVTEHLRDIANFMAYTIGFFHFHSKRSWQRVFDRAGLIIEKEIKITPFISVFVLIADHRNK